MRHLGEGAVDKVSSGEHIVITTPVSGSKAIFKPRGLESALTRLSGKLAAEAPSLGEAAGRSNHVERRDGSGHAPTTFRGVRRYNPRVPLTIPACVKEDKNALTSAKFFTHRPPERSAVEVVARDEGVD